MSGGSTSAASLPPLHGLVLAGGKSRRMGEAKSVLRYHGLPQHEWTARLLDPLCREVRIGVAEPGQVETDRPLLLDRWPGEGPVAAILGALESEPAAAWLVVACDLPFLDEKTLEFLVSARSGAAATAYRSAWDGKVEPLCAIYEPGVATAWREGFSAGERCARKLLAAVNVRMIDLPRPQALDNVNTPEERAEALERLEREVRA